MSSSAANVVGVEIRGRHVRQPYNSRSVRRRHEGDMSAQAEQVFTSLAAPLMAAGAKGLSR
jgi:hypothetical protein